MPLARRTAATLTGGVLCAPVLLLGSPALAAGEATPPPAQATDAFCAAVPSGYAPFTDIGGNTFEDTIECLRYADITRGGAGGTSSDRYSPALPVERGAMASFLVRLLDKADQLDTGGRITALPPFDGTVDFSDVPADSTHAQAIDRLAEAGIVRGGVGGRPATTYSPELVVSRAQMATFVIEALEHATGDAFSTGSDYFTDDAEAVPHEPRINALAAEAIGVGDGRDAYRPALAVPRDQMSGFLVRALAVLEADGDIRPLS